MVPATGAIALAAGVAVDLTGAGDCVVPDTVGLADAVGVSDLAGVAPPPDEATGLAPVDPGSVAVLVAAAWFSGDAVG